MSFILNEYPAKLFFFLKRYSLFLFSLLFLFDKETVRQRYFEKKTTVVETPKQKMLPIIRLTSECQCLSAVVDVVSVECGQKCEQVSGYLENIRSN